MIKKITLPALMLFCNMNGMESISTSATKLSPLEQLAIYATENSNNAQLSLEQQRAIRTRVDQVINQKPNKRKKRSGLPWNQLQHQCEACQYGTDLSSHYDKHRLSQKHRANTEQQPLTWEQFTYKCEACQYGTDRSSHYKQHLSSQTHRSNTGQQPLTWDHFTYKCEACQYGTRRSDDYEKHGRTQKHLKNKEQTSS